MFAQELCFLSTKCSHLEQKIVEWIDRILINVNVMRFNWDESILLCYWK